MLTVICRMLHDAYLKVLSTFSKIVANYPAVGQGVPGPLGLPVLGSTWMYSSLGPYSFHKYDESCVDKRSKYGPVVREEALFNHPIFHLFDKADILKVMSHRSEYPLRPPNEAEVYYRKSRPDLYEGIGVINENGPEWHRLRRLLTAPVMDRRTVGGFCKELNAIADDLGDRLLQLRDPVTWTAAKGVEDLIYRASLESVFAFCLDRRMGFLEPVHQLPASIKEYMEDIKGCQAAANEAMYGFPWWKLFPMGFSRIFTRLVAHKNRLYDKIGQIVDEAIAIEDKEEAEVNVVVEEDDVDDDNRKRQSILSQLSSNPELSKLEVKGTTVDFIIAGVDTVGNTTLFALHQIALHSRVQHRLRLELDCVEDLNYGCGASADSLSSLPYLRACLRESFRMYPTAPHIARILERDTRLGGEDQSSGCSGYTLRAGSVVLCHHRLAALDEANFTRAKEYIPERWLQNSYPEVAGFRSEPGLVMPFGCGKRSCPGKRLAETEVTILIAKLFYRFKLTTAQKVETEFSFLLAPAGDLELEILDRSLDMA